MIYFMKIICKNENQISKLKDQGTETFGPRMALHIICGLQL